MLKGLATGFPVWGDGLVDQSLTSFWYPCSWGNVAADELVFVIPSLVRCDPSDHDEYNAGPVLLIQAALRESLQRAVRVLSRVLRSDQQTVLEIIRASGAVQSSQFSTADLLNLDHFARRRLFPAVPLKRQSQFSADGVEAVVVFELSALACVDRFLADAQEKWSKRNTNATDSNIDSDVTLSDALVASIHSRINAAYLYPQFMFAHELFAAGAWLGQLVQNRPALLPDFVAEYFIEQLFAGDPSATTYEASDRVMAYHAARFIGRDRLMAAARNVLRVGHAVTVSPSKDAPFLADPPVWNGTLSHQLTETLLRYRSSRH